MTRTIPTREAVGALAAGGGAAAILCAGAASVGWILAGAAVATAACTTRAGATDAGLSVTASVLAAAAAVVCGLAGLGPLGPAVSGALALAVWGASAVAVRRAFSPGAAGDGLALLLCGALLSLEGAARGATGATGEVLDLVSMGRALERAGLGALDARDLLLLAGPGLLAIVWQQWARSPDVPNLRLRAWLLPVGYALAVVVAAPAPLVVDLSGQARFSLGAARASVVSSIHAPVLFTVTVGPKATRADRERVRTLRDLMAPLRSAATSLVTISWQTGDEPGVSVRVRAVAAEGPVNHSGADVGGDIARALLTLRRGAPSAVSWWGHPPTPAQLAQLPDVSVQVAEVLLEPSAAGNAAWIVAPERPLSADSLMRLDQHVLGGGGLLMLLGDPMEGPDGPQVPGAKLVGPWGLGVGPPLADARAAQTAEHPGVGWQRRVRAPSGASTLQETEGLTQRLVMVEAEPVALAIAGSVPSSVDPKAFPDRALREWSDGSVRVIAASRSLVAANPGLLAPAVDWVLRREERATLRIAPLPAPGPWRQAVGLLLGTLLGLSGAALRRPLRGERGP